jgi:hypothetical protein
MAKLGADKQISRAEAILYIIMKTLEQKNERAPRDEIFNHLRNLMGDGAEKVSQEVARTAILGDYEGALVKLKAYDATLGGMGMYKSTGVKMLGIYRAFAYVEFPFIPWKNAVSGTRGVIHASCAYLEELIKKMVWFWPWEIFKNYGPYGMPLGKLVNKLKGHIPEGLYQELAWLNTNVYVFAKHHYNLGEKDEEEVPEHYFELDEAVAVYFIVRKLGMELEGLSKKQAQVFVEGS